MPEQPENERLIPLSGQPNFRDLGGWTTVRGRRVKWRQLYRSGELSELSDGDVEKLSALEIRTAIDLRGGAEAARKDPSRLPPAARPISIKIEPGNLDPILGPAFASGDFSSVPPDLLLQINRDYIQNWRDELGSLLRLAADPANRPLLFHCTHGKDRTGIAAAVLLSALEVPWQTVLRDYMLSNRQRREHAEAALAAMQASAARQRGLPREAVDMSNIRGLFFVDSSYLEAARSVIDEEYGSMESLFREGMGWSEADLRQLREELLE
jgi:protein-tyrosine phosphatase